jgi:hypothetical protein
MPGTALATTPSTPSHSAGSHSPLRFVRGNQRDHPAEQHAQHQADADAYRGEAHSAPIWSAQPVEATSCRVDTATPTVPIAATVKASVEHRQQQELQHRAAEQGQQRQRQPGGAARCRPAASAKACGARRRLPIRDHRLGLALSALASLAAHARMLPDTALG